mgnify:CR=1 FL=1
MADRPIECSECKKPATVHYTEVVGKSTTCTTTCPDCIFLQQRLYQYHQENPHGIEAIASTTKESCKNCGTPRNAITTHNPVGCSTCYKEFSDEILCEIQNAFHTLNPLHRVFIQDLEHCGRKPGEKLEITLSERLLPLQKSLDEALTEEDYEQAALLRDQIQKLTDSTAGEK